MRKHAQPLMALTVGLLLLPGLDSAAQGRQPAPKRTVGERIVRAAERHLGKGYVFGGRDGRPGCVRTGKRVRCASGIDCQSLIFFAYEQVLGTRWTRFSVFPSVSVRRQELGRPVPGLAGVLAAEVDPGLLRAGDVLFFLLEDYNLDADPALLVKDGRSYGTWHTGLVHSNGPAGVKVIHAKPGDEVTIEPLGAIEYDGLFVVRWPPESRRRPNQSGNREKRTPTAGSH